MSLDEWLDREICKISQHSICEKETHYNKNYEGTEYCTNDDPRFPCRYQSKRKQFVYKGGNSCDYLRQCSNPKYNKGE